MHRISSAFLLLLIMSAVAVFWKNSNIFSFASSNQGSSFEKLVDGNARFAKFSPTHPDESKKHLKELADGQHPFAVIVCCSDSRVSPELLFDQGVGDLFVIRTAGNLIGPMEMGSIEYAVEHLGANLVVVMGHEKCGAVKAMIEGGHPHGHIRDIVDSLSAEEEIKAIPVSDVNRLDDCVKANVKHGIHQLQTGSEIIREKLASKELTIVGARYDLDDLKVSVIQQ
jgi:carbonic anhydrase